jgi:hypothetical protein
MICLSSNIVRWSAALIVAAASSSTLVAAPDQLPLRGKINAVENNTVQYPIVQLNFAGSGQATQLGAYTMTMEGTVNLLNLSGVATAQIVAANGDQLITQVAGQATLTGEPGEVRIVEIHTITSGTGRFAGATGSFTLVRVLNQATGVSSGTFEGQLSKQHPPVK